MPHPLAAIAQILLSQDFTGNAPLDPIAWDYNRWQAAANPSYYGRTQIAQSLPKTSDGALHLTVQTYLPGGGGFLGNDIATRQSFAPDKDGIAFIVVAKLVNPVPGLDAGMFTYRFEDGRDNEIDFETLTNLLAGAKSQTTTNYFVDEPLGGGHPLAVAIPDPTRFLTYRIEWYRDEVRWFVNDREVRTLRGAVPHGAARFHLNFWAVAGDFQTAYAPDLRPAENPADNRIFGFDVSAITIARLKAKPTE